MRTPHKPASRKRYNRIVYIKGEERYEFRYRDDERAALLNKLGEYAANPDLSLTWFDACLICHTVHKLHDSERTIRRKQASLR
jgi:hypothetical protein